MSKGMIAVVFGGQSSEHEVSCMSVQNVISRIDTERYDMILIGITKEGHWLKTESPEDIKSGAWRRSGTTAIISPDATDKCVIVDDGHGAAKVRIDVVFAVLHGRNGEDGTIQGLCELAEIPYVGCGVLSSAVTMDKYYTKIIVDDIGIRQADFVLVYSHDLEESMEGYIHAVEQKFSYPVFIKPSVGGSSCGVSRADNREELINGLREAAKHDAKILVEEMINGREIECAVLGGGCKEVKASGVGEILAAAEFYDYDAKYNNPDSQTVIDPDIPAEAVEKIRDEAVRIFKAVDGYGLSRVDFFVTDNGEVVFNEINTIPGFTAISMYPMLWEAAGIGKKELIQTLIDLAAERNK